MRSNFNERYVHVIAVFALFALARYEAELRNVCCVVFLQCCSFGQSTRSCGTRSRRWASRFRKPTKRSVQKAVYVQANDIAPHSFEQWYVSRSGAPLPKRLILLQVEVNCCMIGNDLDKTMASKFARGVLLPVMCRGSPKYLSGCRKTDVCTLSVFNAC